MAPAPTPFHVLRAHSAPISALHFTTNNTHLFSGDQDGNVAITDLTARRVVAHWHAHEGGVLGVGEWEGGIVSQGRDNKITFYEPLPHTTGGPSLAAGANTPPPKIAHQLASNSLNFCRFSLAPYDGKGKARESEGTPQRQAFLALPNLTESELIDIYHLPSMRRLHAAVNFVPRKTGPDVPREGLVMSVHLHVLPASNSPRRVALTAGFEDGRVEVWTCPLEQLESAITSPWDGRKAEQVWVRLWTSKAHNEAVMAMATDRLFARAFTVSADHLLCKIDLAGILEHGISDTTLTSYSTKQIGNSSVAVSSDGRVVAVGGWDGRTRLFSAATFKPLGTLSYHRESVQALAFAQPRAHLALPPADDTVELGAESESSDDEGGVNTVPRERWLATGGKDRRIALWGLMDFARGQ